MLMFIYCRLPDDVLFVDEPQIARWDYDNNNWRMDGFSDFSYDEGTVKLVNIQTSKEICCTH